MTGYLKSRENGNPGMPIFTGCVYFHDTGLPLSAGMGCAVAFTCPCACPRIHGDRTSVAYSSDSPLEGKLRQFQNKGIVTTDMLEDDRFLARYIPDIFVTS